MDFTNTLEIPSLTQGNAKDSNTAQPQPTGPKLKKDGTPDCRYSKEGSWLGGPNTKPAQARKKEIQRDILAMEGYYKKVKSGAVIKPEEPSLVEKILKQKPRSKRVIVREKGERGRSGGAKVRETKPIDLSTIDRIIHNQNIPDDKPPSKRMLPATTAANLPEYQEQQVARCEALMLKGLRDSRKLSGLLGEAETTTKTYIRRVYARWEITGSDSHLKRFRGEAISRLDLIETELWITAQKAESDERTVVVVMQQLMALNKQRSELLGLTPDAIGRIVAVTDEGNEVVSRMNKQTKMVEMLSRFSELLAEGKNNTAPLVEVEKDFSTDIPAGLNAAIDSAQAVIDTAKDRTDTIDVSAHVIEDKKNG